MVHRFIALAFIAALLLLGGLISISSNMQAHAPHMGLDFSMEADVDGDTVDDCGTDVAQPSSCVLALNAPIRVREYLNALGDVPSYRGMQLHFGFGGGVTPASDPDSVWPGCASESFYFEPNFGHAACGVAASSPSIVYAGLVGQIFFACTSDGAIDLMHGINQMVHTHLTEFGVTRHAEGEQTMEVVSVTCDQPAPYPADTDGDNCPDEREASSDEQDGGRRNFLGAWDYFNPTGDGLNRIDDALEVVNQYFIDSGDEGYNTATDRTPLGPHVWNLGPPDGLQRVDDILASVYSYFHDCS